MKVFHFNPATGVRGKYIATTAAACSTSNLEGATAVLPKDVDSNWSVATKAAYRDNTPLEYDIPVCFCLGLLTAGTDTAWHWVALLPTAKA